MVKMLLCPSAKVLARQIRADKWRMDVDGYIHFTLTSNGYSGGEWIDWFQRNGGRTSHSAESVLRSAIERPTKDIRYPIVICPDYRIQEPLDLKRAHLKAGQMGWRRPHWEVAPLLRRFLADHEIASMKLEYIAVAHDAVECPHPQILFATATRFLRADHARPKSPWTSGGGFAFIE